MLTDDDLIRELEAGFREESAGLAYTGRVPAPRRGLAHLTALPLAAAAGAVVVLPQLGGPAVQTALPDPAPTTTATVGPTPSPTPRGPGSADPTGPALVTDELELAGFSVRYRHAAGTTPPSVVLFLGVRPPAGAEEVDLTGRSDGFVRRAWVGTDPTTGKAGLFVQTDGSGPGEHAFFSAEGITLEEWARMVRTGSNG